MRLNSTELLKTSISSSLLFRVNGKAIGNAEMALKMALRLSKLILWFDIYAWDRVTTPLIDKLNRLSQFFYNLFVLRAGPMKVVRSLKTLKSRHRQCQVVRRRGRIYVINKQVRKFKARQG